jgi:crotonobetainyl-CoA:carnitine CoA-transferase CaiB-like acyl-CoA transferase
LETIAARLATATTEEWVARFTRAGVLASRINEFTDWLNEPQVAAINAAPPIEVFSGATLPVPHSPGQAAHIKPCPAQGEHTDAILREFGLD